MPARHWTDDELIARLYGVGPEDGHLEECGECAARWRRFVAVRERALVEPEVSQEFLTAQRRRIYERIEAPRHVFWKPALGVPIAATAMILAALLLSGPKPSPQPTLASSDRPKDAELFADIYDTLESAELQALSPVQGLFEEKQ